MLRQIPQLDLGVTKSGEGEGERAKMIFERTRRRFHIGYVTGSLNAYDIQT